ncbi:hypothetical protein [Streptomyces glomeratus]|uniref:Uncharacterized protein n=1 Tax=Streptomyces glomeratus TaxID=284452 RepID=A0ABP6L7P2_9ACTN|nr:hypothetical protein [Streptomyces glomeratus]MCF1507309.1 hypothetical protein [Streptomyces glomeratus]
MTPPAALPFAGAALHVMRTAAGRRALHLALLVGGLFALGFLCEGQAHAVEGTPVASTAPTAPAAAGTPPDVVRPVEKAVRHVEGTVSSEARQAVQGSPRQAAHPSAAGTRPAGGTRPASNRRSLSDTRFLSDTGSVSDTRFLSDTGSVSDTGSLSTIRQMARSRAEGLLQSGEGFLRTVSEESADELSRRPPIPPIPPISSTPSIRPLRPLRPLGPLRPIRPLPPIRSIPSILPVPSLPPVLSVPSSPSVPSTPPVSSSPGFPGLPDLPGFPGAPGPPGVQTPPARTLPMPSVQERPVGGARRHRPGEQRQDWGQGPRITGADAASGRYARRALRLPRPVHAPLPQSPDGAPNGVFGVFDAHSAGDDRASRHGDGHAVAPHHRAPLRLLPGATAVVTADGTRDRHRNIPKFPG